MNIELEIGIYDEGSNKPQVYDKHKFDSIDSAIGMVDFLKMSYNATNDSKGLVVRLNEGSRVFLLDYDSQLPLKDLRYELAQKYKIAESTQEHYISKLPTNSNFVFKHDENVQYAKTSLGEMLPFKVFNTDSKSAFSNLLTDTKELGNGDFALLERQFTENKNLQFFGTEKITSLDDIAFLFQSLEDEAVEHAFLLYDFKDKGYFVQHISSGAFSQALVDPKSFLGNVMEVQPSSITLVHNHPSGNLVVSKPDRDIFKKIQKAIEHTNIKMNDGIIINLRSGQYVRFNEHDGFRTDLKSQPEALHNIPTYSFSKQVFVQDYQPTKISTSKDTAKYINSQKFGVSDKTELLIMNQQLQILGKFMMPQTKEIDFILNKVLKFGGTNAILYGNNITPEIVNNYNEILKPSGVNIIDGIQFKSENADKMYKSFADEGTLQAYEEEIKLKPLAMVSDAGSLYNSTPISTQTKDDVFLLQEIGITPIQRRAFNDDIEFGTRNSKDDYTLSADQLKKIPDFIDGYHVSTKNKQNLIYDKLSFDNDFVSYAIKDNVIIKKELDKSLNEILKPLNNNEIQFTNQNNLKMENTPLQNALIEVIPATAEQKQRHLNTQQDLGVGYSIGSIELTNEQKNSIPDSVEGIIISKKELLGLNSNSDFKDDLDTEMHSLNKDYIKNNNLYHITIRVTKENNIEIEKIKWDDTMQDLVGTKIFATQNNSLFLNNLKMENIRENYVSSFLKELYDTKPENSDLLKESYSKLNDNERNLLKTNIVEIMIEKYPNTPIQKNEIEIQKEFNKLFATLEPNVIMENQKEFDQVKYLKDQLKYIGFGEGEKLRKDLENGINSNDKQFQISTTSDKVLQGNKAEFRLNYYKSDKGGVYLNSYDVALTNSKEETINQKFPVKKDNYFTAKEVINLMEGRAVKNDFLNPKTEQVETAFFKLNLDEPKNEFGNYNFQTFYKNYGIDTNSIVEKSNIIFDKPEYKETTIASLEKGNVVKVKFELDNKIVEGKAVLNPQYKNLSLYDNDMTRINTNKALEGIDNGQSKQKGNVREQGISRGL